MKLPHFVPEVKIVAQQVFNQSVLVAKMYSMDIQDATSKQELRAFRLQWIHLRFRLNSEYLQFQYQIYLSSIKNSRCSS